MAYCNKCGAPNDDTNKFCQSCGNNISAEADTVQEAQPVQKPQEPVVQQPQQPVQQPPQQQYQPPQQQYQQNQYQQPPFQQPYQQPNYYNQPRKFNGLAIGGFVISLLSVLIWYLGFVFGILGVILSAVGLSKISSTGARGRGLAIAGIVLGIIGFVYGIIVLAAADFIFSSIGYYL